jgi:hypothetical protein
MKYVLPASAGSEYQRWPLASSTESQSEIATFFRTLSSVELDPQFGQKELCGESFH